MDLTPQMNANINDHSQVDDSIKQEGLTINASGNATINSNSGNGRASKVKVSDMLVVLCVSVICDIIICGLLFIGQAKIMDRLEQMDTSTRGLDAQYEKMAKDSEEAHRKIMKESEETHKKMMKEAKEGNIWLLRYDIVRTIDLYEVRGKLSAKEYARLKDEYAYYRQMGGNHDVQDRFDQFTAKLLSGQVKVEAAPT